MKEYFSHDYTARSDVKIKKLIMKHGMIGYGVFWAIIEDLYINANALQTDCDLIAHELRVESDLVNSIINDFDLFFSEGDLFGSESVGRRLSMRNEKSEKASMAALTRWGRSKSNADAMQTHSEGNAILCKEKERKGKKVNKENTSLSEASAPDARPYQKMLLSKIDPAAFDLNPDYFKITLGFQMLFRDNLQEAGSPTKMVDEAKGKWYDHIRLMIETDKVTTDQLRELYLFIKSDVFWKKNILSTETLRRQKEKLLLAIKEQKEKAGRAVSSQIQNVNWNVNQVDTDF